MEEIIPNFPFVFSSILFSRRKNLFSRRKNPFENFPQGILISLLSWFANDIPLLEKRAEMYKF